MDKKTTETSNSYIRYLSFVINCNDMAIFLVYHKRLLWSLGNAVMEIFDSGKWQGRVNGREGSTSVRWTLSLGTPAIHQYITD